MELNQFIFPAPKCSYKDDELREMIKIPYYEELFKKSLQSPKTRIEFHKINPFHPPEEIPNDVSAQSFYDDQIDELPSQRIPKITQTAQMFQKPRSSFSNLRISVSPRNFDIETSQPSTYSNKRYKCTRYIPCLYLKATIQTKRTIIYFHANCEDLKTSYNLVDFLRHNMKMNVLSVEYPGYGTYIGEATEENICKDAEYVYKYIAQHSGIQEQNIIIMGRSIGTGVALHIASLFKPLTLVLISPFLSLQEIINEKYPMLKRFIKDRFVNHLKMSKLKCPTFILHGLKDNVINVQQSKKLYELCQTPCLLRTPPEMTHVRFQFDSDLAMPLMNFLRQLNLL